MALFQDYQHYSRQLTEEERAKLEGDSCPISEFKRNKLEKEAQRNWDLFYKRNSTNFFKDRHWTSREFHELCSDEGANVDLSNFEWAWESLAGQEYLRKADNK